MQPDLDRLLRDSRAALPDPGEASVARAIERLLVDAERHARRRRVPLVGSAVVATTLVVALGAVAADRVLELRNAEAPARVVDRTLVCTTGFRGGLRLLYAGAHLKTRTSPTAASVGSGGGTDALGAGLETGPSPAGGRTTGAAFYNRRACRQLTARIPGTTRVRVPLTARGLRGGAVDAFGKGAKCEVPRQVLVRVRAVFSRPTRWAPNPDHPQSMRAPGTIPEGYLAVRTQSGRPLVFASVTQTRARLFLARGCWRD